MNWEQLGATMLACQIGPSRQIDVISALETLGVNGLTRVFCEGGGALAASLLKAGLVDELIAFQAGKVIGSEGRAMIGPLALTSLATAPNLELVETHAVGNDTMTVWRRA